MGVGVDENFIFMCDTKTMDFSPLVIYFLSSAAEKDPQTPERAVTGLGGWIECFENARLAGSVFAGGVNAPGDIKGHAEVEAAYQMGKAV